MGWLLTIILALPPAGEQIEVRMWFSQQSYCTFAEEKFLENPIVAAAADGGPRLGTAEVLRSGCRRLDDDELHLVPEHMRAGVERRGGRGWLTGPN